MKLTQTSRQTLLLLLLLSHFSRKAETKRKKEFNLEAWEKETSNTVS